jgi:hypothetical protein
MTCTRNSLAATHDSSDLNTFGARAREHSRVPSSHSTPKNLLKRALFARDTFFILGDELRSVARAFVVASECLRALQLSKLGYER